MKAKKQILINLRSLIS